MREKLGKLGEMFGGHSGDSQAEGAHRDSQEQYSDTLVDERHDGIENELPRDPSSENDTWSDNSGDGTGWSGRMGSEEIDDRMSDLQPTEPAESDGSEFATDREDFLNDKEIDREQTRDI